MEQILNNQQKNDLKSTIFEIVNAALDFGIKAALPDFIEDDAIEIKNRFIKEGFLEGCQEIMKKASSYGTFAKNLITGNLSQEEVKSLIEKDGILNSISDLTDSVLNKIYKEKLISKDIYNLLKNGKKEIINAFEQELNKRVKKEENSEENNIKRKQFLEKKGSVENLTENEKNLLEKLK